MTRYVLGVDGGGTKTQAVILDETGRLLGSGRGGPSNYGDVGPERTQVHIGDAVDAARRAAGQSVKPFDAVFLGLANVASAQDQTAIRRIALHLGLAAPERIDIDHDCRIALAGGLSGRPGIVLIAGTGSACFGINAAGERWRAGGWSYLIADEGSGYWLGVETMKAAVRAYDGRGPSTILAEAVMNALNIADMNDIMHRIYAVGMSRMEIAALAPLVIDAALQGDAVSMALVKQGAGDLADCVLAVARRLRLVDHCELAYTGGLFSAGETFIAPLQEAVSIRLPGCAITAPELPPVLGAGLLALRLLGVHVGEALIANLWAGAAAIDA